MVEHQAAATAVSWSVESAPWLALLLEQQKAPLVAFASKAVGKPVTVDTRRFVGCGSYGCVMDVRAGRQHTGYVLKVSSDESELLGWSWLQKLDLLGAVKILAVGKGPRRWVKNGVRTWQITPVVVVREKVGDYFSRPDAKFEEILYDYEEELWFGKKSLGRVRTLAGRLKRHEPTGLLGDAILTLLDHGLLVTDLHVLNVGWRGDDLVLLDPSMEPADLEHPRRPGRLPNVIGNPGADEAARRAERRALAGDDPHDRARVLVDRLRAGVVSSHHLAVAGWLGDEAARLVVSAWTPPGFMPVLDHRARSALSHAGFERPLLVRLAADFAARVLHFYEERHAGDGRPRAAIVGAREWAARPSAATAVRCAPLATAAYIAAYQVQPASCANAAYAAASACRAVVGQVTDAADYVPGATEAALAAQHARAAASYVGTDMAGVAAGDWQRLHMIAVLCGDPVEDPLPPPPVVPPPVVRPRRSRRPRQ